MGNFVASNLRNILAVVLLIGLLCTAYCSGKKTHEVSPNGIVDCLVYTKFCESKFSSHYDEAGNLDGLEIEGDFGAALVLYEKFESAAVALNTERGHRAELLLNEFLNKFRYNSYKLIVTGHADVAELGLNVDDKGYCSSHRKLGFVIRGEVPASGVSNECLAFLRAVNTYYLIQKIAQNTDNSLIEVGFDPSPFMKNTNELLGGELLVGLNLNSEIQALEEELGIPENYTHSMVNEFPEIQKRIREKKDMIIPLLLPFRSVVIYVVKCEDIKCELD